MMRPLLKLIVSILCFTFPLTGYAQDSLVQRVRGYVLDAESNKPLEMVTVVLLSNQQLSTYTDSTGYFILDNVPVGRQGFQFSLVGYQPKTVYEILVTSGKATELNISLTESLHKLDEVTVSVRRNKTQALNEFATVSARSFSVEETRRYAASISDPARMAMNFAGVANNGDLDNDIVVRGNSPRGILWRLEGIEIPNPNHFSELGSSGGGISMLNANTLGTSDFYTGAFPPEYGNALSGVFDLNLRNGNKDNYEHIFQIGLLGTEIATEGPFKKGGKASYLIDYRYSTLALIQDYVKLNGLIPDYQDVSLKLNFPTARAGTFSVWGIGGANKLLTAPAKDSTVWSDDDPNLKLDNHSMMAFGGVTHQYFINTRTYIKTILSGSYDKSTRRSDTLNTTDNYNPVEVDNGRSENIAFRASVLLNSKLDNRNTIRTGIIFQQLGYNLQQNYYDFGSRQWTNLLDGSGSTQFYQAYVQWKNRLSEHITLTGGLHGSYYALSQKYSIEPRAAMSYSFKNHKLSLAAGMHSKPDHISTYLYRSNTYTGTGIYPNQHLDLQRAIHTVLGYDVFLPYKMHLKAELYYQYLYHLPVETDSNSGFSIINSESVFALAGTKPLASNGKGENYGIDITFERPFADNYYFLLTGSLYRSTYTTYRGISYNGHFNRGYQLNLVAGKEFYFTNSKRSLIGLNGKIMYSGGQRETPIDLTQSVAAHKTVYVANAYYTFRDPYYLRIDGSLYYKRNNRKATHTLSLDIQNITNRRNYSYNYFDVRSGSIRYIKEAGLIPAFSYRIEFHR